MIAQVLVAPWLLAADFARTRKRGRNMAVFRDAVAWAGRTT